MNGNHSVNFESGEAFRQALSDFRSCMDRQDWSGAAEKAALALQIPGYADDPRITDIYEELAAKVEAAVQEWGSVYTEEEIRLVRIKFIAEMAN